MSEIGIRIAKFREKTGLSTKEFGDKIGISNASVSNIETGSTENPSVEVIRRIQKAFNLSSLDTYVLAFGEEFKDSLLDKIKDLEEKYTRLLNAHLTLIENLPQKAGEQGEVSRSAEERTRNKRVPQGGL